jgi:hypothetical protein
MDSPCAAQLPGPLALAQENLGVGRNLLAQVLSYCNLQTSAGFSIPHDSEPLVK